MKRSVFDNGPETYPRLSIEHRIPGWKAWILKRLFPSGIYVVNLLIITDEKPRDVWVRFPNPGGLATVQAPRGGIVR